MGFYGVIVYMVENRMTNIYPNLKLSEVITKAIFLMDKNIDFRVTKDEAIRDASFTVTTVKKE